ncbi:Methyl-Accepting Chemotaxis Protein [Salisediminibacterium beveridgei]|uniref:Methyl-Accepting Chemotaxis Protein n=2 Tax=Salisediminibacterium beveridgei TaxID=632773 RepID=A0A1D7QX04_9BACI|nr:Methyl-Accepting Chemotaxis Protein [Salisediminibacterium beveridgei]
MFNEQIKASWIKRVFGNYEWYKSWGNYYNQYDEYVRKGEQFVPDVYDYMFEENIVHKYGNRKLAETIPVVFVSAGILGTFIGLVSGISDLNLDAQSEEMRMGVQDLLGGMEITFYSSILGITLSLLWHLIDKVLFYPLLVSAHRDTLNEMDITFPSQDEGHYLQQMVENQQEQLKGFQEFMSEQMIPQLVKGIGNEVADSLRPQMEQTNEIINEAMLKANDQNFGAIQDLTDNFIQSLGDNTKDYMDKLSDTLDKTINWTENVHGQMTELVDSMTESAQNQQQMAKTTHDLSAQVETYVNKLTESEERQLATLESFEEVTANNAIVNEKASELLTNLGQEQERFTKSLYEQLSVMDQYAVNIREHYQRQQSLNESIETVLDRSNIMLTSFDASMETNATMLSQYETNTKELADITSNMTGVLSSIEKQSNHLLSVQNDWQKLSSEVLSDYEKTTSQTREIAEQRELQVEEIRSANEALHHVWTDANKRFEELNKQLDSAMSSFATQLHKGLNRTFEEFDEELSKTVNHLSSAVEMIQDSVDDLPPQIDEFGKKLKEFNQEYQKQKPEN